MSNLIESAAKGLKSVVTGTAGALSPDAPAAALPDRQNVRGGKLVENWAKGGMALGAGASAAVALLNYLRSLQKENELEDESRLNDDTLYISAPTKPSKLRKSAAELEVNRWVAPGLAVTGGILSAGGAYALTQAVYNYLQKKRRQSMLDEAQGEALTAADLEVTKKAAEDLRLNPPVAANMNLFDLMTAFPVAVPLLAALASGGVAYSALRKTFPTVQHPKSKYPKRIRQVSATGEVKKVPLPEGMKDDEEPTKSAADLAGEADCEDAANEFLMLTVDQMATEKKATVCLVSDLLHKVAADGITGVAHTQREGGLDALMELVKGARQRPVSQASKIMAAAAICKSARLRPVATVLAAAEFQELVPSLYDEICSHGADQLEKFAGIAPLMHLAFFRPQILEKSAAQSPLMAELQQMLAGRQMAAGAPIGESMMGELTTDAGGGFSEEAEGGDEGDAMREETQPNNDDPVDEFMAAEKQDSPLLNPEEQPDAHTDHRTAVI